MGNEFQISFLLKNLNEFLVHHSNKWNEFRNAFLMERIPEHLWKGVSKTKIFEIDIALVVKICYFPIWYAVKNFSAIGEHLEVPILCQKSTKSFKSMIFIFFLTNKIFKNLYRVMCKNEPFYRIIRFEKFHRNQWISRGPNFVSKID